MKDENKLALIIAFYISKYDGIAYKKLGYGGVTNTHNEIGKILGLKGTTIQNMRDEFDPYHENSRKGWHKRGLLQSRKDTMDHYEGFSEEDLRKIVISILKPNLTKSSIFNEMEDVEITVQEKEVIEGEVIERKFLSYKRNAAVVRACKERDRYTCLSCDFWHYDKIVECHHLKPLAMIKEAVVNLADLITLCPNCHKIAHSLLRKDTKYTDKIVLLSELQKEKDMQQNET